MTILTIKRIMSSKLLKEALMLLLVLAMAISACTNQPSTDTTPAPSEAASSQSGEDPTAAPITDVPTETPMIDQTETPMPELPSEEWLIDEAWKIFSRVAEVHDIELDKNKISTNVNELWMEVMLEYVAQKYAFMEEFSFDDTGKAVPSLCALWYNGDGPTPPPNWSDEHLKKTVIVTPEELRAAGCTETEGERFMDTLGRVCAEKLLERYKNEPKDSPFHAKETKLRLCKCTDPSQWEYRIGLALRGVDLQLLGSYFGVDIPLHFVDDANEAEFFGWLALSWTLNITPNFDGTWSCTPVFGVPAG